MHAAIMLSLLFSISPSHLLILFISCDVLHSVLNKLFRHWFTWVHRLARSDILVSGNMYFENSLIRLLECSLFLHVLHISVMSSLVVSFESNLANHDVCKSFNRCSNGSIFSAASKFVEWILVYNFRPLFTVLASNLDSLSISSHVNDRFSIPYVIFLIYNHLPR